MSDVEPQSMTISLFGSDTSYWVYNPKRTQTIFMIHGFRGNHVGLRYVITGLSQYRIIIPDLPGFGASSPMTSKNHGISGYSDFAREFLLQLGLNKPVLLGHSFGTIIAAHLAAEDPDLFAELILINPISVSPRKGLIKGATTGLVQAYYWLGTNLPESWSQRVLKSRTFNRIMSLSLSRTKDPALRRLVYAHHLRDLDYVQHKQVIAEAFEASITKTALDDAARIAKKTLLIAGQDDPIVPARTQKTLHKKIEDSQLILIPQVGHLIHLETPESASRAITDFLN